MLTSPPQDSERRQATIMFADISGFTAMSEKLDAEEVTAVMNDCFDFLGEIIKYDGGKIDKFIGDCVMALFGVPTALEDAPQRAINAAIDMRNGLEQFNREKELRIPLEIHIGINSGEVISGSIGSRDKREYTVMGDAVNLASRLEDASERGQILVGLSTYHSTKGTFEYRELPPFSFKGKREPVSVFELLSQRATRSRVGMVKDRRVLSQMVGRQKELDRLELQVMKAINGEGSIVNLIGEAGIGKSRLVEELKVKDVARRTCLLEGRGVSTGKSLGFHPVTEMLCQ